MPSFSANYYCVDFQAGAHPQALQELAFCKDLAPVFHPSDSLHVGLIKIYVTMLTQPYSDLLSVFESRVFIEN